MMFSTGQQYERERKVRSEARAVDEEEREEEGGDERE